MAEYMHVWRANVADGSVERLLELEPVAIAEAQRLCPELLGGGPGPPGRRHLAPRIAVELGGW
jgi:hypothetical protein